jgi:spermidine synthase
MMGELWESDPFSPIGYHYKDMTLLHEEQSAYQIVQIHEHPFFGRILVLDGVVQLTQKDEHFYHEMLVHPSMHAHPAPKKVLVVGGGDGGSIREVLRHPSVETAVLVDIDSRVTDIVAEWIPSVASSLVGPLARSEVERHAQGGAAFLESDQRQFDVIIIDSTDPVGPATELFESAFYAEAFNRLTDDGILVTQSESLHFHAGLVRTIQQRLAQSFPIVDCYAQSLSTYAGNWWTFSIASKKFDVRNGFRAPIEGTRYYDAEVHRSAFLSRRVLNQVRAGTFP